MIPSWPWWIWVIIGLVGLLLIILEGAYHLVSQKDAESKLQLSQKEQEFNDKIFQKDNELKAKEDDFKVQIENCQSELEQLKKQLSDSNKYITLTEAVSKLIEDSSQKGTMAYYNSINIDINGLYNKTAKLIAGRMDIYGNSPSSQGHEKIEIPKDVIERSVFKNIASQLWSISTVYVNYNSDGPAFIDLAIKKDELDRTIQEILSEGASLFEGY